MTDALPRTRGTPAYAAALRIARSGGEIGVVRTAARGVTGAGAATFVLRVGLDDAPWAPNSRLPGGSTRPGLDS